MFVEKPGGKELSEAIYEKFKALKGFLSEELLASMEKRKQQKEVWDKIAEQRSNSQVHGTEEANNLLQKYIINDLGN